MSSPLPDFILEFNHVVHIAWSLPIRMLREDYFLKLPPEMFRFQAFKNSILMALHAKGHFPRQRNMHIL